MSLLSRLRSWSRPIARSGRSAVPVTRRPRASARLGLEALERRDVPSTLTVTSLADTGNPGDGSLRGSIAAAHAGDSIVFDSSLNNQTIVLTGGQLVINKSLTIQGPITISGGGYGGSRVFEVDGSSTNVTLSRLTIRDGQGTAFPQAFQNPGTLDGLGGGIYNAANLTLRFCTISNNGGYIDTSATMISTVRAGGGIYNAGTLTVSGSTLSGNYAGDAYFGHTGEGGGIYNLANLTMTSSTITDNHAYGSGAFAGNGGGLFNAYKATANLTTTQITYNSASVSGGGIDNLGTLTITQCSLGFNSAGSMGGGIFNNKTGHLTIQSSSASYDTDAYGTDVFNIGQMKISKDSFIYSVR